MCYMHTDSNIVTQYLYVLHAHNFQQRNSLCFTCAHILTSWRTFYMHTVLMCVSIWHRDAFLPAKHLLHACTCNILTHVVFAQNNLPCMHILTSQPISSLSYKFSPNAFCDFLHYFHVRNLIHHVLRCYKDYACEQCATMLKCLHTSTMHYDVIIFTLLTNASIVLWCYIVTHVAHLRYDARFFAHAKSVSRCCNFCAHNIIYYDVLTLV